MSSEAQATLLYPFESGALDLPSREERALYLGALPSLRFPDGFDADVAMVQGLRPDFVALQRAGFTVLSEPTGDGYDLALILATKHRGENEMMLAEAISRVKQGGLVVMAGGKTDGIASLRKRLEGKDSSLERIIEGRAPPLVVVERRGDGKPELSNETRRERLYHPFKNAVPPDGALSKNHGMVFWLRVSEQARAFAQVVGDWWRNWPAIERRFDTQPGMFSHDRVDAGSKLLAAHLPANLKGKAADFCAGWGYLSVALAEKAPGITSVHLFEADHASLEAARKNMALVPNMSAAFHWVDLAAEKLTREFDVVVMNPPFHQGRAADPGIGQVMIRAASKALKPGGQLFMVANRGLPYEAALKGGFGQVTELADESGFRVWRARR